MANKIILKKSSVAEKVPTQSDLDYGELALNYADGVLYYKRNDNTVQPIFGYTGSQGTIGYTGSASTVIGYTGSIGGIGYTGSQGDNGIEYGVTPPVDTTLLWLDESSQYGEGMYGVPAGGVAGQVLTKSSSNDFDIAWGELAARNVRIVAASDNILVTDGIIVINSSSPVVLTLPTATGNSSKSYLFKNLGTSTVTIQGTGGQLIDTYSTLVMELTNSSVELVSIGTGWIIY